MQLLDRNMDKEKGNVLFRILFWPMNSMNDTIVKVHARMESDAPDDAFLEEDKRAIGIGGPFSGCIITIIWLMFLLLIIIVSLVLIVWCLI